MREAVDQNEAPMTAFALHELGGDGFAIAKQGSVESALEYGGGYDLLSGASTWSDVRLIFGDLPAWMADEIVVAYGDAEAWPDDSEDFDCPIVLPDDTGSEIDRQIRASMLDDLPADLFDRFDIVVSTIHDGDLGLIAAEQLDTVVQTLEADGHTVVWD